MPRRAFPACPPIYRGTRSISGGTAAVPSFRPRGERVQDASATGGGKAKSALAALLGSIVHFAFPHRSSRGACRGFPGSTVRSLAGSSVGGPPSGHSSCFCSQYTVGRIRFNVYSKKIFRVPFRGKRAYTPGHRTAGWRNGRRRGLKIPFPQGSAGSTPAPARRGTATALRREATRPRAGAPTRGRRA